MHTLIGTDEAIQIVISVLAITVAMALVFAGLDGMFSSPKEFIMFLMPILVTMGSGFILHEMAHKLVAIHYGAQARFRMWLQGIVFMLVMSVIGVLFAAPGAVYIYAEKITRKQNGIISLAGPVLNIFLLLFFILMQKFAPITQYYSFLTPWGNSFSGFGIMFGALSVWQFGAAMNLILALFNMIPAFPLDGSKVFAWNKLIWIGFVFVLLILGSILIQPGIVIGWGIMLLILLILSKLFFQVKK
ncbi:MAG: site-2 protease family protein [Candidatus Micrarchaeota archaeon]